MTPIVVMAGGRGLRLRELTDHQPKPMIPVGAKPMLHSIVEHHVAAGFKKFFFCLGYKGHLIEQYFGDGSQFGARIRYVREDKPLGTGGALKLLPKFDVPFIVTNADVLCDYAPSDMMDSHAEANAALTMGIWRYEHQIRYGVAEVDETRRLVALNEKPVCQWAINAGIYVVEPRALEKAPAGPFHMTDLMDRLDHVHCYPIEGDWHDVGTLEDLERANNEWGGSVDHLAREVRAV